MRTIRPLLPSRLAAVVLAASLVMLGLSLHASANATFQLARVAGTDRYDTASAIAANGFASGTQNVVIARGDQFPDALAGAYVAGVVGGPVLLTDSASLSKATKDRLASLGTKNVYLLGGTSAISQAVQDELGKTYTVTRFSGQNRYDTASRAAQISNSAGIGTIGGAKTAIVASGEKFPDALAAGSAAFAAKLPIILTQAGQLPSESQAALTTLGIKHAVVVGGTSVVSADVVTKLTSMGIDSERYGGATRYATATLVADFEAAKLTGWSTSEIDLASGDDARFPDALAGGPAAGRASRPIILTSGAGLSPDTASWLNLHAATLQRGRVFGGTAAVSDSTVAAAVQAAGGAGSTLKGQVVRTDTANHRYTFVPDNAKAPVTVNYKAADSYAVDGKSVTMSAFESAVTPADSITYTGANGTTPASHILTNVDPTTITSGTVGAVNEGPTSHSFKIVNPVTGDPLTAAIDYSKATTFKLDGATSDLAGFDGSVSLGDTISISGTTYSLTNHAVTGAANTVTHGSQLNMATTFKIDLIGDDPTAGDNPPVITGNDTVFKASGGSSSTDVFSGDASDWSHFDAALSDGDTVTYSRSGGKQTFTIVNQAPTVYAGQAVGTINQNPATGNTFTLATSTGTLTVTEPTCGNGSCYEVNGSSSTQAAFEAAYSAGDLITYRAADATTSTTALLALTDQSLAGQVAQTTINTTGAPSSASPTPHSYGVLASNGFTILSQVTYADSQTPANDDWFVNGTHAAQTDFEAALNKIAAGTSSGYVVVDKVGSVQTHRLTLGS